MCRLNHLTPSNIKITISGHNQQCYKAKAIYAYKNTKDKLHRANAGLWFNKMSWLNYLMPNYIRITISGNNQQLYTWN